jgi:cation diffusion facilitator family transporter
MSAEGSTKAIVAALVANAGIAVAKFVAFLLTGAASMLAESIHSVADSSNQGLLLLGGRRGRRAPTPQHPFGHGRERYFWSFVVALVLFTLGGAFALYEGVQKLLHPHEIESVGIAIGVLLFAIALETFSLRTAVVESRKAKGDATWWEFIRHSRSPELPVVLLEDIGAEAGLVLALIAVGLAQYTGNPDFDAYGTMSIGVLLLVIAVFLMIEMKGLLIGETARPRDEKAVLDAVGHADHVKSVIHMRTQHLGPDDVLVGMKIELEPSLDVAGVAAAINETEDAIRAALPAATIVYVEPDVRTPGRPAEL